PGGTQSPQRPQSQAVVCFTGGRKPVYPNKKGGEAPAPPPESRILSSEFQMPDCSLEVEMRAQLEEARLQHVGRPQPLAGRQRRERVGHRERPVAVEDVV